MRVQGTICTRVVVTLCLLPAVILFGGCGKKETVQKQQKKPPVVAVEAVTKGKLVHAIELTGTVEPYRVAQLASPAEGPVVNIQVREGDEVKAGDILLGIGRKTGLDAMVSSAQEDLKKEADNLSRTQQLVETGALAAEQLDMARTAYEKARAQLAKAEEMAGDYSIAAPWQGIVSNIIVKDGDYVSPRSPLVEMYDPASSVLRAAVPERYASDLREAMDAEVRLDAFPGTAFAGRIVRLYPYLEKPMRTRLVEIEIAEQVRLLPGMFGRVRLTLDSVDDAMTVPLNAISTTPTGSSVVFVVTGGKAVMRKVKTGIDDGSRVQILTGVNAGEQVIVSGQEKLKDGAEVRVAGSSPADGKPTEKVDDASGKTSPATRPDSAKEGKAK